MSVPREPTHPDPNDDRTLRPSELTGDDGEIEFEDVTGPETTQSPLTPRMIGPYRIENELGRGGMGIVYEAVEERLGRRVALKVMTSRGWAETASLERFRREAAMTSRLDHPGICQVYAAGAHEGLPFIAMQCIDGKSLADHIHDASQPTDRAAIKEIVRWVEETADALHAAHEAGVIHRDVKPGNIMIRPNGHAVVLDFGLARMDDDALPTLTQEGDIFGTPAYMSPERLTKDGVVDRRCDIYALGAILYEALASKRPFSAPTHQTLFRSIAEDEPESLRKLNPSVWNDLAVIVMTALEKNPDRRYATAKDLASDLARVRHHEAIMARPPSFVGRVRRWAERQPAVASLVLVITLAIGATGGLGGWLIAELPQARLAKEQARLAAIERDLEAGFFEYNEARYDAALDRFNSVLETGAHTAEAGLGLALTHLRMQHPDRALAILDTMPGRIQETTAFRLTRFDILVKLDRADEAEAAVLDLPGPSSALDHFLVGLRLSTRTDTATMRKALRSFTIAALRSPHARALFHHHRSYVALRLGDTEVLSDSSADLMALWPDSSHTWLVRAYLLSGAPTGAQIVSGGIREVTHNGRNPGPSNLHAALAAWHKALEFAPESPTALINIGITLHGLGRKADAITHFESVVRQLPNLAVAWFNLGLAKERAGDIDGAIEAWKQALQVDPNHLTTLRSYCGTSRQRGDHVTARELLDRALVVAPNDPGSHVWDGVLKIDQNDREGAREAWEKAVAINPRHVQAFKNLGRWHSDGAEFSEAAECWVKAYTLGGERDLLLARNIAICYRKAETPAKGLPILDSALKRARTSGMDATVITQLQRVRDALQRHADRLNAEDQ